MIKFAVPVKLETNNALLRMHWAKRRKYQARLRDEIFCAVPYRCNNGRPRVKKTVKILYLTKRLQDYDNYVASCKPLIDCLTQLELIHDDSPEWISLHAEQSTSSDAYKVLVEII